MAQDATLWKHLYTFQLKTWVGMCIDPKEATFPKDFHFGIATSEYQYSGMTNCPGFQWATFEGDLIEQGMWTEERLSGIAHDHWNNTKKIVAQLADLGVTSYRFSAP